MNPDSVYIDFFSGLGAWSLGAYWAGCRFDAHYFSDIEPYVQKVFKLRFPDAAGLGDVSKISGAGLRTKHPGARFVFSGSFQCQDLSGAGKMAGLSGSRSGLWYEYLRLINEVRPAVVMVENVGALAIRGLDKVVAGLSSAGYDCEWRIINASDAGAWHRRERMWIIAYPRGGLRWFSFFFQAKDKEVFDRGFRFGYRVARLF